MNASESSLSLCLGLTFPSCESSGSKLRQAGTDSKGTAETPSPRTTSRSPSPARDRTCAPTMGIRRMPCPAAADDGAPGEHPHSRAPTLQAQPSPDCLPPATGRPAAAPRRDHCYRHPQHAPPTCAPATVLTDRVPHPIQDRCPLLGNVKGRATSRSNFRKAAPPPKRARSRESSHVVVAEAVVATEAATPNSDQIPCPPLSTKWPRLAAW